MDGTGDAVGTRGVRPDPAPGASELRAVSQIRQGASRVCPAPVPGPDWWVPILSGVLPLRDERFNWRSFDRDDRCARHQSHVVLARAGTLRIPPATCAPQTGSSPVGGTLVRGLLYR